MKIERQLNFFRKRDEDEMRIFIKALAREQSILITALESIANTEEFSEANAQGFNFIAKKALEEIGER